MVQEDQTTHEHEVEASGETNQHKETTRVFAATSTRGSADATVSNGHWKQTNRVDVQRHNSSVHVRTNNQ